jgi:hypothetical protein
LRKIEKSHLASPCPRIGAALKPLETDRFLKGGYWARRL